MSFDILKQLQYCTCSDYGNNLNKNPSRIIPFNLVEDNDEIDTKNIIHYVPQRLGNEIIICDSSIKLPEPSAYFRGANTFIKSFLYLTNGDYYNNIHLPLKAKHIMELYIKNLFEKLSREEEKNNNKKLIQYLLNNKISTINVDPKKHKHFNKILKILLNENNCEIVIIKENSQGCYKGIVPSNFKSIKKNGKNKYILLEHYNGLFSPYGTYYKKV